MNPTIMNIVIFFSILLLISVFIDWLKFSKYLDKVSDLTRVKNDARLNLIVKVQMIYINYTISSLHI